MKTRNLFLSLFAFAAICACNKEAQPEGPKVPEILDAETYIKVNIMSTGASTRADYEYGTDEENAVKNVLFLFYGATEKPVLADGTTYTWTPDPEVSGNNIAKSATVKFKAQTEKPTSMIVVLNYDTAKEEEYREATLTEVKDLIADSYSINDGVDYYTMTNTVYTSDASNTYDDEDVICEVELNDSNFGETTEKGATTEVEPVNVYVERVAAKVVLTNHIDEGDVTSTVIYIDGAATPTTVTPVVVGYDVVNTPDKSYLFKKVDPEWDITSWTKPTEFRSFWADSYASVNYVNKAYEDVHAAAGDIVVGDDNDEPYPTYVHENTLKDHTTKVILTAKLTVADGADADSDPDILELVQYKGKYYTFAGFVAEAKEAVKSTIDLSTVELVADPTSAYEMKLKLKDGHSLSEDDALKANTALSDMVASYWDEGKCYYFTDIKHDLTDPSTSKLLSGVVRNHVYKVTLNSISGLGIPVSGGESEIIIPSEPVDKYYSLNATINILQWKIVEQGVDFNN